MEAHYSHLGDVRWDLGGRDRVIQRSEEFGRCSCGRRKIENESTEIIEALEGSRQPAVDEIGNAVIFVVTAQLGELGLDGAEAVDKVAGVVDP